ncbi:hypothetical protein MRX96_041031 [Rhipicephalus microplus]
MPTYIDDDDFDDEPVANPKTGAHGATDKIMTMEEERIRVDTSRVHQRKLATQRDLTTPNNTGRDNDTAFPSLLLSSGGPQYDYHLERSLIDEERNASARGGTDARLFCQTSECRAYVHFLEHQLDPNHEACGNLYDHVCSRWKKRYEKLASERSGSVACVDDIFVANYQDRLIALLLNKGRDSYAALRNLFQDCVSGRLATNEDVERTLDAIMAVAESNDSSVEAITGVIARMATLGASPFFEVAANVTDDTAHVLLLPRLPCDIEVPSSFDATASAGAAAESSSERHDVFRDSLKQKLCLELKRMATFVTNCVVTLVSNLTSAWSKEWYRTNGQERLFKSAVATLQPFLALTTELSQNANLQPSSSVIPGHLRGLQACLRLIDSYDSASLSSLGASVFPTALQNEARESLRVLNKALGETFPSAPSIKFKLGQPPPTTTTLTKQDLRPKYVVSGHDVVNASTTGESKLMKLLRATTWDKWTNHRGRKAAALAFSTMPTSAEDSPTVYVPLPVFNVTATKDPLVKSLKLARIGPRVLKTLFSGKLATALSGSRLSRCISELQKGRRFESGGRVEVDVEEAAAFYVALKAYRHDVGGEALAISGSPLNSDSLFLIYYVLNKCEVDLAAHNDPICHAPSTNGGRSQVESIIAAFPGVLFEECQKPLDPPSCDVDEP